ncbi:cache domain-containing protein [Arcobacter sp. LA11]|uniref:sensor histidine kinase n=1 Tax=Arcobacter sp. LA11 TaxID=1898176 RepID=UPI0009346870|nr:cache domain-containing protein [Arcobacter sp. LA11]
MQYKNETQILNLIKYGPSLFILIMLIIVTSFLYFEKTNSFEIEKINLQNEYRENRKNEIKNRVYRTYDFAVKTINKTEAELKKSLKDEVYQAYSIIENIYNQNIDKSKEQTIKMIKDALRTLRFNDNRGYFFIFELEGKNILNAGFPNLEGKNLWNYQDLKGTYLLQEMNKILKKSDETYYSWYWNKPTDKEKEYKKVGFFKKFEPFNWFIGTGEYEDEFKNSIENKILGHIRDIRFEKTNYIFVVDYKGNSLVHINPKFEGKNFLNMKDLAGHQIAKDVISIAKKGEGYLQYPGIFNPEKENIELKTSFIKGLEDLNWSIGTGFYEDELKAMIERKRIEYDNKYDNYIANMILICILITFLLLLLSKYISVILEKKFKNYQKEIKKHIEDNTRQHNLLSQKSKMAAMGEMIGNIAHQWRQPLSSISTAATGMKVQKEIGVLSDKLFNDSVDGIMESATFLSRTIDDFSNFFKPDKEENFTNIKKLFQKAIKLVKAQYQTKNIEIIYNIEDIDFLTLENELIQVILNIFNNSRDELVKIENDSFRRLILIDAFEEDGQLIILIKDNAGGIPTDIISRIFEPYFSTKHQSQGTGIGLYMSEEIIVKHLKGKLEALNESFEYDNIKYQGATFRITLDMKEK